MLPPPVGEGWGEGVKKTLSLNLSPKGREK